MAYSAEVIADSISGRDHRMSTVLATYPRMVHSEHLRHRSFSFSVASSRALPAEKLIEQVLIDPVLPIYWGANQRGMSALTELTPGQRVKAEYRILKLRDAAVATVQELIYLNSDFEDEERAGLHKQIANRYLEPWMWVTVLTSGTEWANFFFLRCHPAAQPEMRYAAELMRGAMANSTPQLLRAGEWHLPFVRPDDWSEAYSRNETEPPASDRWSPTDLLKQVSAGRCARTSYLTHLGVRDLSEDVRLHGQLLAGGAAIRPEPMHLSPLEHQATPLTEEEYLTQPDAVRLAALFPGLAHKMDLPRWLNTVGNLVGWRSQRSSIVGEAGPIHD